MDAPYRSPTATPPTASNVVPPATLKLKRAFNPWLRLALAFTIPLGLCLVALLFLDHHFDHPSYGMSPWQAIVNIAALSAVGGGAAFAFSYRKAKALAVENNNALGLLRTGRLDEAERVFEGLARRARRQSALRAVFLMNLGLVKLRRGLPDQALPILEAVEHSGWLARPSVLPNHPALLVTLATTQFALGDFSAAAHWLGLAQQVVPTGRRGMLLLAETLLAARAGDFERAVTESGARWQEADGVNPGHPMRALRMVRALALQSLPSLTEPSAAAAREADIAMLLAGAQPATRGEFDYLARSWPEFKTFLTAHGLAA